ncbi:MAG: DUF4159 domain-containing protein [Acidobacteria bacterium]|nr:DUF4159 domain-containing protein [Acidobacteriota bacterium]
MRRGFAIAVFALCAAVWAQREFRVYDNAEGAASDAPLPPDYSNKSELVLGRLMYPSGGRGGFGRGGGGNWLQGRTNWTIDYPKGDRFFASAIRRLTRVDVRSVEQPVNPDDGDDIYYWPYLHVSMPGNWKLTDQQALKIRDYLQRGGFLFCDSFFGTEEWQNFQKGLRKIFPDREVEDLRDGDAIFQTVFDIKDRYQVGNYRSLISRGHAYRADGDTAFWRVVRDDRGHIMVAMAFNSDLGDSWQLADEPRYPEKFSALGIRIGVNYVVYAMSH